MANLWRTNFKNVYYPGNTPVEIVQKQCGYLSDMTRERVIARITEYEGDLDRLNIMLSLQEKVEMDAGYSNIINYDVQNLLGDIGQEESIYEFYLTSKRTPKYKFRAFFMYHGIMLYPVTLVIEEGIAQEIDRTEFFLAEDEDMLLEILEKILSSERIATVVNNLLKLNKE